jgi:uncharacterized protein
MNPPFLKETGQGTQLAIKLQPRASRQQVSGVYGNELKISVTAPPVDAAANRALIEYIAELCDIPRSAVELIRGQTSRHKTVLLKGISGAAILDRLKTHLR